MTGHRKRLYPLLLAACFAGYAWLSYCLNSSHSEQFVVCLFRRITGIPCPSCGATRSLMALADGRFQDALFLNPLGYLLAAILIAVPLWVLADIVLNKNSLLRSYQRMEIILMKPKHAIPLIAIVLLNWIWNISKGI